MAILPFPRQLMIEMRWPPYLIEYFYQLHLAAEAAEASAADSAADGTSGASIIDLTRRLVDLEVGDI